DEAVQDDVGERVTGDHDDRIVAEEVANVADTTGGAEELLLVAVLDAVAEVVADRVREVMEVGDQLVEALAPAQIDDVRHHGTVQYGDHRLRDLVRERA